MTVVETAMLGQLPYTALRDAIIAHPTAAEGLIGLFAGPLIDPERKAASAGIRTTSDFATGGLVCMIRRRLTPADERASREVIAQSTRDITDESTHVIGGTLRSTL